MCGKDAAAAAVVESHVVTTLRRAWDDHAGDWLRWARTPGHDVFFWRFGLPRFLELLPPPGRFTIDAGCGEGRLTRVLRDRGYRVAGFEPSARLAGAAATHPEAASTIRADAVCLPVKARGADLYVSYMVLQDVDDLDGVVREAARVLGGGGRACLAIVHPAQALLDRRSYFEPARLAEHVERDGLRMTFESEHRPLERYARALEDAGLLIEAIREPVPDPELVAEHPEMARFAEAPWAIYIKAIRALWAGQ